MPIFDTHFHLFDSRYQKESALVLQQIIDNARQAGVTALCNVGTDLASSRIAVTQAQKFNGLWAAVGYHPTQAHSWNKSSLTHLRQLLAEKRTVAIGEIGLDFHHRFTTPQQQKQVLVEQLKLAEQHGLPVLLHIREAYAATLQIVQKFQVRGIVHCFSGTWADAQAFLRLGFYLSIAGPVTFKNARALQAIVCDIPLNRLVVETDAPYLAPVPHRGQINFPEYIRYTVQAIANLKNLPFATVARETFQNAQRVLGIE